MSDSEYNPHAPLFLLSQSIDGVLAPTQQEQLEAALAASAELRAEAEQLRAVCKLIEAWGTQADGVDADSLGEEVSVHLAASEGAESSELAGVDDLLRRWSQPEPKIDWEQFHGSVMKRIAPERSERSAAPVWGRILRLGTPLAAAAAIALAYVGYLRPWNLPRSQPAHPPIVSVRIGPQVETLVEGAGEDVFEVTFGRDSTPSSTSEEVRRGPSCVIAGASLRPASYSIQPPL